MKRFINNKKSLKIILNMLLVILLLTSITFASVTHNNIDPDFSLEELSNEYSTVYLAKDTNRQQTGENTTQEKNEQQIDQSEEQPINEQTQSTQDQQSQQLTKQSKDKSNADESSAAQSEEDNEKESETDIEITENATETNEFFTTTIIDNEIVTVANYYFTIQHKNHELTVADLQVSLNHTNINNFDGGVKLKEGSNKITVDVYYEQEDGQQFHASRTYNVILNTKDIIISTNLQYKFETTESVLTFTASAKRNGQTIPIEVTINKRTLKALGGTVYKTDLDEGQNDLIIRAIDADEQVEKEIQVIYHKERTNIILSTDLKNQKVTTEAFQFYANAKAHDEVVPLQVALNDTAISPNEGGDYNVTLKEGTNVITLEGEYNDELLIRQFKILYKNPNAVEQEPEKDPKAPVLKTDLVNNERIQGNIKTFNVWPVDANGKRIRGNKVAVTSNGVGVPYVWDDSTKTSYKLILHEGENKVAIRVWDDDGRSTTENFIIHSTVVNDGDVIGKATISIEASTVGLGYLIPPTTIEIRQNEKTSYVLDQLLRNNGFSYDYTGTLDKGFYLKSINKTNLMQNAKIPDDLRELVEASSTYFSEQDYYMDSLGEFDFSNGSGWMYSINGDYPNYSFSDSYLLDGDVVRIRFTLHYGKDIGGYGGMGGDASQDWYKEW